MKPIYWIIPAAAMVTASGCIITEGPTESRTYANTGFDHVSATSGINVVVSQGPFAVTVQAPEGKLDRVTIEQEGSELKVGRKSDISWLGWSGGRYEVRVSAPAYAKISASGGADVEGAALQGEALSLSASGGGDIEVRASASADGRASSGGDVRFIGAPAVFNKDEASGGDVSLEAL